MEEELTTNASFGRETDYLPVVVVVVVVVDCSTSVGLPATIEVLEGLKPASNCSRASFTIVFFKKMNYALLTANRIRRIGETPIR